MTPISHKDHPELRDRPPLHPCAVCKHAISESWWLLGHDICSRCWEAEGGKTKPKKRTLQQEGNEMADKRMSEERQREVVRLHNQGLTPWKIAKEMHASDNAVIRALTERGITPHKAEHARPVRTYHREDVSPPATSVPSEVTPATQPPTKPAGVDASGTSTPVEAASPAPIIEEAPDPKQGYCMRHGQDAIEFDFCPDVDEKGRKVFCVGTCIDWRNTKPDPTDELLALAKPLGIDLDAQAIAERKEELLAAVDEQLGEMEPEPKAPETIQNACWNCKHDAVDGDDEPCRSCHWANEINPHSIWELAAPEQTCTQEALDAINAMVQERFGHWLHTPVITPTVVSDPAPLLPEDPAMDALMRLAEDVPNTRNHLDLITIAHELGQVRGMAEGYRRCQF